LRCWQHK